MGLVWVIITLALNTVGASAYAIHVRNPTLHAFFPNHEDPSYEISFLDMLKLTCLSIRKTGSLAASISLEPAIRFSILWLSLQGQRIRLVFCRHSAFYISMGILAYGRAHDLSYVSKVDLVFYTLHLTDRTRFIGDQTGSCFKALLIPRDSQNSSI